MGLRQQLAHAWNAFTEQTSEDRLRSFGNYGSNFTVRPDRIRRNLGDKSIISSIYNRIGIDAAAIDIQHVRLNNDGQLAEIVNSGLNNCLTIEANIDQAARAFRQDIFMTLFEKGTIAIVPVDTSTDPTSSNVYDIKTMRVGEIVAWYPENVKVSLFNEKTQRREEVTVGKNYAAIVENPLYSVMNEQNSTLQRLIRKLNLLDSIDEQMGSGKLDMIIQLPYVIKSDARRQQAEERRKDIEVQLKGSQYGIAYTDGTEKITQLNRPAENNMLAHVTYLTNMVYGQLGLTEDVFNGTASEAVMLNYYNRTIEPVITAVTEAMKRTFLTKTARTQNQSIAFYRDPFKLMPIADVAEIADKLARNEVMTSNELRSKLGLKPSSDPKADQLVNSNMPQPIDPKAPVDRGQLIATPTGSAPSSTEPELPPALVPVSQLK